MIILNNPPECKQELVTYGHENYTTEYYHKRKEELGKSSILYFTQIYDVFKKSGFSSN